MKLGLSRRLGSDDGEGHRFLPVMLNLQQAGDKGLFVMLAQEAAASI